MFHGVFRRQFFQVVERDLKKALVVPMLAAPLPLVAPSTPTGMQGLRDVMAMHREGLLNAEEFKPAKRVLLGL